MIRAAEFTNGSKRRAPSLDITEIDPVRGSRTNIAHYIVTGKAHARQIAAEQSAKPWNF